MLLSGCIANNQLAILTNRVTTPLNQTGWRLNMHVLANHGTMALPIGNDRLMPLRFHIS